MDPRDLCCVSNEITVPGVLSAYRSGLFPMGVGEQGSGPIGWWSPVRRGVLFPGDLRVSKSLRKSVRKFKFSFDAAFPEVVDACADPDRPGAWITPQIRDLYCELHDRGVAHSVEVWKDGKLAGGLYGVWLGKLFAGESMFHRVTDASKAALVELVHVLSDECGDAWIIDTQWQTPHLKSLGVSEIVAGEYRQRLSLALQDVDFSGISHKSGS